MLRPPRLLLLSLALAACSSGGSPPASPPPASASAPSPVVSASPLQAASSAPAVSSAAPEPAPPLPEERVPFALAAQGRAPEPPEPQFYSIPGALFLHAGTHIAKLGPSGLTLAPTLEKTIPRGWTILSLFGMWPKSTFAEIRPREGAETKSGALYRVDDRGFTRLRSLSPETGYIGAWYGADGRVGAVVYVYLYGSIATWIEPLAGPKGGVFPRLTRRTDDEPRLGLFGSAAFPSGQLLLFGVDRADDSDGWAAVERWEPGSVKGVFEHLPEAARSHSIEATRMSAGSPTQVWISGLRRLDPSQPSVPYLAHWDGARWSLVDMPGSINPVRMRHIAASAEGELWLGWVDGARSGLLRRKPDGRWSQVPLPEPPPGFPPGPWRLLDLLVHEGELWLSLGAGSAGEHFAVYRTSPGQSVLDLGAVRP